MALLKSFEIFLSSILNYKKHLIRFFTQLNLVNQKKVRKRCFSTRLEIQRAIDNSRSASRIY